MFATNAILRDIKEIFSRCTGRHRIRFILVYTGAENPGILESTEKQRINSSL